MEPPAFPVFNSVLRIKAIYQEHSKAMLKFFFDKHLWLEHVKAESRVNGR